MRSACIFVAAAFIAAPTIALAQEVHGAGHDAAAQASMDANQKMMADMQAMEPSGDADKDFVLMMIPHHQGAIDMAKLELQYGKDPELKAMAEKIIADQEKEIAAMHDWLARHGQ
jgi:uncharacterized protein (DUF305 family)